jgi:ABC-type nitrate/sulfonate/bicarbonate transport system substrate-binding protein
MPNYTFNSLIVRRHWVRDHADILVRHIGATRRAVDCLDEPASRDEAVAIPMNHTKVGEKYARDTYDLSVVQAKIYAPQVPNSFAGIPAVIDLLAETGELTAPRPPSNTSTTLIGSSQEPGR